MINNLKKIVRGLIALISVPGKVVGESLTALENDVFALLFDLDFSSVVISII